MAFYKIAEPDELPVGGTKCARAGGRILALARLDNSYHAVDNVCPHRQGQLCDGSVKVETGEIVCALHGWNFDLKTGVSPYDPKDRIKTYPIEEREDGVYVDVAEEEEFPPLSGYLDPWRRHKDDIERDMDMIHRMAYGWIGPHGYTEPMRTVKQKSLWDNIVFLPRQLSEFPMMDEDGVELSTVIGKTARKPIAISLPVYVSHMSFGAISREAKIALARGSAMAGTMICSGEGGMLPEERENAAAYILEMASGYFGWNEEAIAKADGVEIKIGQASKAGMGGTLPGKKVTDEIARVRGIEPGKSAISPARFPDMKSLDDMKKRVEEIRKITGGRPVGVKFAASRLEEDLAAALELEPDFITIDGRGGATAAAPKHIKDNVCVPTLYALDRARRFLEKHGAKVDLVVTGGLRLPADFAKAIAIGATAVACATASLIAIGCQQYRACHTGRCPVGIATHDPRLRERLDIDTSAGRLHAFFETTRRQLSDFARICGHDSVHNLSVVDIATTSHEIASYTSIKHVGQTL